MKRIIPFIAVMALLFSSAVDAQLRFNKLGVGASGSMLFLQTSDAGKSNETSIGGGLDIVYSPFQNIGLRISAGTGQFKWKDTKVYAGQTAAYGECYSNFFHGTAALSLEMMTNSTVNPFVYVGGKYYYFIPQKNDGTALLTAGMPRNDFAIVGGGGLDFFFSEFVSLTVSGEYAMSNAKRINFDDSSGKTDNFISASIGLKYYFFDQAFMTRMLKALEERYKR